MRRFLTSKGHFKSYHHMFNAKVFKLYSFKKHKENFGLSKEIDSTKSDDGTLNDFIAIDNVGEMNCLLSLHDLVLLNIGKTQKLYFEVSNELLLQRRLSCFRAEGQ